MSKSAPLHTSIKAVISSVYGTLLERGEPHPKADAEWSRLWREKFRQSPRITFSEFNGMADHALQADADIAKARGVIVPTPYWPAVATRLLPELKALTKEDAADFLYTHAQLRRSVRMVAGADLVLRELHFRGILLGLISNGHPHTPLELALALRAPAAPVESFIPPAAAHGVFHGDDAAKEMEIFTPPLCFWSFSHGFGKPNLHVFQHISTRLRVRGIEPHEVLMVGENEEGDLQPAAKFGWRNWLLTSEPNEHPNSGGWIVLARVLGLVTPQGLSTKNTKSTKNND